MSKGFFELNSQLCELSIVDWILYLVYAVNVTACCQEEHSCKQISKLVFLFKTQQPSRDKKNKHKHEIGWTKRIETSDFIFFTNTQEKGFKGCSLLEIMQSKTERR